MYGDQIVKMIVNAATLIFLGALAGGIATGIMIGKYLW